METQKITWEDFQKGLNNLNKIEDKYSITNIECPKCGKFIYKNNMMVLTSYPPKTLYECLECGWKGSV